MPETALHGNKEFCSECGRKLVYYEDIKDDYVWLKCPKKWSTWNIGYMHDAFATTIPKKPKYDPVTGARNG